MDFFNSLSQVAKNRDNFKKWEKNQKDEQAKREELYNRRQYSDAEIAKAQALGENIIDIVDIMDNHSESVAENVETATTPLVAASPYLGLGISGLAAYKGLYKPSLNKYKQIKKEFFESDAYKSFENKFHEMNHENSKMRYWSPKSVVRDKNLIEKQIHDSALREEALELYKKWTKDTAFYKNATKLSIAAVVAGSILSFIGMNIYAAKLQVDSSKIARYQARESLKDPKAFVDYTPEQIAKAKEEIENNPELKKKKQKDKLHNGFFKSLFGLFKDRKAYLKSVKNDTDDSKIVTRELTPEEIKAAQQDQEVIQRSIRLINNEAEKYGQNMEVAAGVLIGGTPILGGLVGGAINWILNKTGVIEKFVDNNVKKNGSEETKALYADLKKGKESGKGVLTKWSKFAKSFADDLSDKENNIDTAGKSKEELKEIRKASRKEAKDIWKWMKRTTVTAFAHPTGKNWIISGVGTVVTGIAGMAIGLKLEKSASRAGRYTAKQELQKDPRNFIGYTQDDYNEVSDVKYRKKDQSKFKEVLMFIPTCIKQYYAYDKYKKNEYKEKQLLQEQLMKQEVSEEQLKDAKNLQRKLFNTFEKVDDNSQTYSESMEAAIDIAQPFVIYGAYLTALSPFIYYGIQVKRGKLSPAKLMNKFAGFMSKSSERMKSKWFKNYLKDVAENVSTKVQETEVSTKPMGVILNGVHFKNDTVGEMFTKIWKNFQGSVEEIAKMDPAKQSRELFDLRIKINDALKMKDPKLAKSVDEVIRSIDWRGTPQSRADALSIIINPKSLETMPDARFNEAKQMLNGVISEIAEKAKAEPDNQLWAALKNATENIDADAIRATVKSGIDPKTKSVLEGPMAAVKNLKIQDALNLIPQSKRNPKAVLDSFKSRVSAMSDDDFALLMERMNMERLGMDKKTMLEIIPKLEKMFENIPKEEVDAIWNKVIDEMSAHPDEFIKLLTSGKIGSILMTPNLKKALAAAGISWATFTIVMTYAIESWLADIKLKAGRLGVMKAMDGLQDHRYYANIEPTTTNAPVAQEQPSAQPSEQPQGNTNLLSKYMTK